MYSQDSQPAQKNVYVEIGNMGYDRWINEHTENRSDKKNQQWSAILKSVSHYVLYGIRNFRKTCYMKNNLSTKLISQQQQEGLLLEELEIKQLRKSFCLLVTMQRSLPFEIEHWKNLSHLSFGTFHAFQHVYLIADSSQFSIHATVQFTLLAKKLRL